MLPVATFVCPHCEARYKTSGRWIGQTVQCGGCGEDFRAVAEAEVPPDASIGYDTRYLPTPGAEEDGTPPNLEASHDEDASRGPTGVVTTLVEPFCRGASSDTRVLRDDWDQSPRDPIEALRPPSDAPAR